jgi:hypothetical protein
MAAKFFSFPRDEEWEVVQGSSRPAPNRPNPQFAGRGGGGWPPQAAGLNKAAFPTQSRPKFATEGAPASEPECWFYKDAMGAVCNPI